MKKHFYSEIIEIDPIILELNSLGLSERELNHLVVIAHETLHHKILDNILDELNEDDKKIFLFHIANDSYELVWEHLEKNIKDPKKKILKLSEEFKQLLLDDIKKLKKKR